MDKKFYSPPNEVEITAFAEKHLSPYVIRNREVLAKTCPFCKGGENGDTGTFFVSLDTGQYCCHRGKCGVRGGWIKLLRRFGEAPNIQSVSQQFKPLDIELLPRTDTINEYFANRGISQKTLEAYQVSADGNGNIIFPFFIEGELIYAKFRQPVANPGKRKEWAQSGAPPVLFGMDLCDPSEPLVITEGQCFPGDAEILTESGWIRFDQYDGHSKVMVVDQDLNGHYEVPKAVIKKPYCGDLMSYRVRGIYSSITTPDHSLILMNQQGEIKKQQVKDIVKWSSFWKIPTAIRVNGKGIPLSNDQIALYLAVSADCALSKMRVCGYRHARFAVKKPRKYERLKGILNRLGLPYHDSGYNRKADRYYIGFSVPSYIESKVLPISWITDATLEQRDFILHEQRHWDGNEVPNRNQLEYSTTVYENALVMQSLAHTAGYMSTIIRRPKTWMLHGECRHSVIYKVSILFGKDHVSIQKPRFKCEPYDGIVYCVSVSTGMILVRQEEHITVTGNCDALSLAEVGIRNAVSVPTGCENFQWLDNGYDWCGQFKKIILFGDNDPPGRKMINILVKRLGEERCYVVDEYPPGCKDANDILVKCGVKALLDTFASAKEVPIRGLVNLADVEDVDPTAVPRIKTMIPRMDAMANGLAFGGITIFTGK